MTTDRRNALGVAVMAATLITKGIKSNQERTELVSLMEDQDITKAPVRDADGVELGTVTLCGGDPVAKVVDEAALLRWVKENRPDQIREMVDLAYRGVLLKAAEEAGAAYDPATGEIVPGIDVVEGNRFVRVTANATAKTRMADLIESSKLLELTQAPASPEPEPVSVSDGFEGLDEEDPW